MPTPQPAKAKATAASSKLATMPTLVTQLWARWVCTTEISSKLDGWQTRLEQRRYKLNTRPCRIHNLAHAEWNIKAGPEEDPKDVE